MDRPCACSWKDCAKYQRIIASKTPAGHQWNGDRFRLTFPVTKSGELSAAKFAMKKAIKKYFPLSDKKALSIDTAKNLVVARHHFPLALLIWKEKRKLLPFATLLSANDVDEILFYDSPRGRMKEYTNSLQFLCKDKVQGGKGGVFYLQTPMEDKATVEAFVGCLLSGRFERSQKRLLCTPTNEGGAALNGVVVVTDDRNIGDNAQGPPNHAGGQDGNPPILSSNNACTSPFDRACIGNWFPSPSSPSPSAIRRNDGVNIAVPDIASSWPTKNTAPEDGRGKRSFFGEDASSPDRVVPIALFASPLSEGATSSCKNADEPSWVPPGRLPIELLSVTTAEDAQLSLQAEYQRLSILHSDPLAEFSKLRGVSELGKLLAIFHTDYEPFHVGKGAWFFSCSRIAEEKVGTLGACKFYSVRPVRWLNRGEILCSACAQKVKQKQTNVGRKQDRKRKSDRFSPNDTLDTPERKKQNLERQKVTKNLKARIQRLLTKLDGQKESLVVSKDSSIGDVLLQAVNYVTANKNICREQVLEEFLHMEIDGVGGGGGRNGTTLTPEEISRRRECVRHIVEQVSNTSKQLRGDSSQCRFSEHVVNTALCLFLRSKGGYEETRKSGLLSLPSARHLERIKGDMKAKEGGDPILYSTLQDELPRLLESCPNGIVGHLLVDEIKLKNGIAFNCNSNEVTGLVFSGLSLKRTYSDILSTKPDPESTDDDKTEKGEKVLTVYANQWRFRSVTGVVHNGDFYFNCGSLNGNELLRQFNQVVTSYEFLGVEILGLVCDSGGGNASFLRMLRRQTKVTGPWPTIDCVSLQNPVCTTRNIFLWTCSTHGLKAIRNTLFRSQPGKARCLERQSIGFGWRQIVECYDRDEERRNGPEKFGRSDLVYHTVHLDSFTIMNARFAKQAFSERTIGEMMAHVAEALSVDIDFTTKSSYESQWHFFVYILKLLKEASNVDGVAHNIRSTVRILEYQVSVFGLFIERFMDRRWKLHEGNIAAEKASCKEMLKFFTEWRDERHFLELRENIGSSESGKYYLADQTYENLLLCIAGFFAYAEAVTKRYAGKKNHMGKSYFVPALHSNQSSLENLFSQIRSLSKDRTDQYAGGIVQTNMINTLKYCKAGNTMYPEEDIGQESGLVGCNMETMAKSMKRCEGRLSEQMRQRDEAYGMLETDEDDQCRIFAQGFQHKASPFARVFFMRLSILTLKEGMCFQDFLLQNHRFRGFYLLSQHQTASNHDKWFQVFLEPSQKQASNALCHKIVGMIFHLLEDTYAESNNRGRDAPLSVLRSTTSFEQKVLEFLQDGGMKTEELDAEFFDGKPHDSVLYMMLFDILKECFFRDWIPAVFRLAQAQSGSLHSPDGRNQGNDSMNHVGANRNVNRCVGWALWKVLRKYRKKDDSNPVISVLEDMTVQELDILDDEDYVRLYYPLDDILRNRGYLTLLSPAYVRLFSDLLAYVMENLDIIDSLRVDGTTAKTSVIAKMVMDGKISIIHNIVEKSEARVPTSEVPTVQRTGVVREILERLFNMRIGQLVRGFRSTYLTRRNDTSLRTELKVKSDPS